MKRESFFLTFAIIVIWLNAEAKEKIIGPETDRNDTIYDSTNDSYVSYDRTIISLGYNKTNYRSGEFVLKPEYFFNISYRVSNFYDSFETIETQIGLFNEVGLTNLAAYYNAGPELRILRNLYIVPYGGLSFVLTTYGLGFLPYLGSRVGFIKSISEEINIELEVGIQLILTDTKTNDKYFRIGVGFNFF